MRRGFAVEVRGIVTRCVARSLPPAEADELWPHLDAAYHGFGTYRQRTTRPLPIVELVPE